MNHSTIPFLLTLAIAWASMGVVSSRYIGLVSENERAKMAKTVVIVDPPPPTQDRSNSERISESSPSIPLRPELVSPELTRTLDPDPIIAAPAPSRFTNPRFFNLLKDEEWSQGKVLIVLVSNVMGDNDRESLVQQIDQIRKDHSRQMVGRDVFVVGREKVCLASEWLRNTPAADAFETNPQGFVASFQQVQADLNEADLRRSGPPARRLVLWQSAVCPKSLPNGAAPRVDRAQLIWSGGQFSDPGTVLDQVFGKDDQRVATHGPVIGTLANTIKNVLGSPEPSGVR